MTTVFLIGFAHPDAARLADELTARASHHEFVRLDSQVPTDAEPSSSVAVLWCPRTRDEADRAIAAQMGLGIPTVALVQDESVPAIDYSAGHVEVVFPPAECVEALRRIELAAARMNGRAGDNVIRHGELVVDQDRYEVTLGGKKVDLTYKEYELLKYLAARPGRVFNRESLLRAVWDYDYFGGTRTVDVHVRRLRSKINDVRYQFIETVWNVGYRFRSPGDSQTREPDS